MIRYRVVYPLILLNLFAFAMGWLIPLEGPQQLVAYGFSHESWVHLAFNMIALLTFGLGVERTMGAMWFYWLYILAIVGGGAMHLLLQPGVPVIGASAGIFGLMFAYGLSNPTKRVMVLVFPMRARNLMVLGFAFEMLAILFDWVPRVAHFAHLGGTITGVAVWALWNWRQHEAEV